jgi:hypothetical protein
VPYCGNCDDLIGWRTSSSERGCALGGCYGYYGVYGGRYWKEVPVADGRGGWRENLQLNRLERQLTKRQTSTLAASALS